VCLAEKYDKRQMPPRPDSLPLQVYDILHGSNEIENAFANYPLISEIKYLYMSFIGNQLQIVPLHQ
jgi:hypothetical protein